MSYFPWTWHHRSCRHDFQGLIAPADRWFYADHGTAACRIAPEAWRLRIEGVVGNPLTLTFADLLAIAGEQGMTRYVKCNHCIRDPLDERPDHRWYASTGIWGGIPLATVLALADVRGETRRVVYGGSDSTGFYSSIPIEWVNEPLAGLPVLLATELNGEPIPHDQGGPVRMVVPAGFGFRNIKWLRWIRTTSDPRPDGWYERGLGFRLPSWNRDPTLKTVARIAPLLDAAGRPYHPRLRPFRAGEPMLFRGYAVVGGRGLAAVRFAVEQFGDVIQLDQAGMEQPGPENWGITLPDGLLNVRAGRFLTWPSPYTWVFWNAYLNPLPPGRYTFTVWTMDAEGHAQPAPDPTRHTGSSERESVTFAVV